MITAQDIRKKTFRRAGLLGYNMQDVDVFLEELAEDVAATQEEMADLRAKARFLASKVEEYRELLKQQSRE